MFFTFLNKEENKYLDLSVFMQYSPQDLLYFYYGRSISVNLRLYQQMKEWSQNETGNSSSLKKWLQLIDGELEIGDDLLLLEEDPYIDILGPYYYLPTNTSFYFTLPEEKVELITAADIDQLYNFMIIPPINKDLERYQLSRKNAKKSARNREELLRDIRYCQLALREIEALSRHINFMNKLQSHSTDLINDEFFAPEKPEFKEKKPNKYQNPEPHLNKIIPFANKLIKSKPDVNENFQQELKEYYIKYREYEKACDRYKEALSQWPDYRDKIAFFWRHDLMKIDKKKHAALKNMHIYNDILLKSFVHGNYQEYTTLTTFESYLNTGRATNLQDCMNLYEEEKRWEEVKLSQTRIENSIHYIQTDTESMIYAEQELNDLMRRNMIIKKVILN